MQAVQRLAFWLALFLAPAALAHAQEEGDWQKGKSTYMQLCAHCHGINMVNPGVSSYDLRKFPRDDKTRFLSSIVNGKGDMPAWGDIVTYEELQDLWAYVATRGGKEPMPEEEDHSALDPGDEPVETIKEGRLTACLPRNGGVLSSHRANGGKGLDYDLTVTLADALGLEADVTWYESEPEEESNPVSETYAMLAHRLCDIVPSHPLYPSNFGEPPAESAALPRWLDQPKSWKQSTFVPLEAVAVTRPYRRAEQAVVLGPDAADRTVRALEDLDGLRIGIQQGTLGGAILFTQLKTIARSRSVMRPPGPSFLWDMEKGLFDATLVDTTAFDFHRKQNPVTGLTLGESRHPLGFNLAIAYRASETGLGAALDTALAGLTTSGAIERMANADGVTFAPPTKPWVSPPLTLATLRATR